MPINQDIINLYDSFTHGVIDRRAFMERLAKLAGGVAAATAILTALQNNYAVAGMITEDDARLIISTAYYPGPDGRTNVYAASPKESAKRGSVIVIHENRGLNAHIKDIARRMALEGFNAIAPDLLSTSGGTPADENTARDLIGKLDPAKAADALSDLVAPLRAGPHSNGKIGAVGFCWGGGMASQLAVRAPGLGAAVAYYGPQPAAADVPGIKASLMLHYAGKDERINGGIPAFEAALKAAKTDYQLFIYDGVQHAFNNDTNAARYDKTAAELAWSRTVTFLKAKLA